MKYFIVLLLIFYLMGCAKKNSDLNTPMPKPSAIALKLDLNSLQRYWTSEKFDFDLRNLNTTNQFIGMISTQSALSLQSNMSAFLSDNSLILKIDGAQVVSQPAVPDPCTQGMSPALCSRLYAEAHANATQQAASDAQQFNGSYDLKQTGDSLQVCSLSNDQCNVFIAK